MNDDSETYFISAELLASWWPRLDEAELSSERELLMESVEPDGATYRRAKFSRGSSEVIVTSLPGPREDQKLPPIARRYLLIVATNSRGNKQSSENNDSLHLDIVQMLEQLGAVRLVRAGGATEGR